MTAVNPAAMAAPRISPAAWLLIQPIRFYQRFITPYTPASCRYYPTCSAFAVAALRQRGAAIGVLLTLGRLARCNPWSAGGIDRVPTHGFRRIPDPGPDLRTGERPTAPDSLLSGVARSASSAAATGAPGPSRRVEPVAEASSVTMPFVRTIRSERSPWGARPRKSSPAA